MTNKLDDFVVFILSHGRADKVSTHHTLRRCGYTGPIYLVVDNEDETIGRYRELYGDKVIVFDKTSLAPPTDEGGLYADRRMVLPARNACFQIAKDLGYTYFMELDDDYRAFDYRFNGQKVFTQKPILSLDAVFAALLNYYKSIPALSIAIGQSGDYVGGKKSTSVETIRTKRKVMNSFFCSVERPFQFIARQNEDITTAVALGNRGHLFLTLMQVSLTQATPQQNPGGMSEWYIQNGTFVKSFYTVVYAPSCSKIGTMGPVERRLHHNINWNHAVPKIISAHYQKI